MKQLLVLLYLSLAGMQSLSAQTLSTAGASALDRYLDEAIATTRVPGLVALVSNADGVMYVKAAGLMRSAEATPMQSDAIFRLASMTKAITSAAIMQLVEQGKVDLDAPAATYLPWLQSQQVLVNWMSDGQSWNSVPVQKGMTVRQLLTHTSGLGYTFTSEFLLKALANKPEGRATDLPLLFEPGSQWHYGESTRVLGEIVEAVSGEELSAYLQAHLLQPLGMRDTAYDIDGEKLARVVTVHRSNGQQLVEDPLPVGTLSAAHQGDGGLSGTAADYAAFIRLMLNQGLADSGERLLQADTVSMMGQNHTAPVVVQQMQTTNALLSENFPLGAGVDSYGLGFQRTEAREPGMRHVGSLAWAGIYNTEFWIDPEAGIGAVLLMQYLPFYDSDAIAVLQGFEQRVYAGLAP